MPSTHKMWVVLIGNNFYPDFPNDQLKGCVQDVDDMKDFFKRNGLAKPSTFSAVDREELLKQNASSWPTVKNITRKLDQITKDASKGDSVWIHYSGHGTYPRKRPTDFALVLLEEKGRMLKNCCLYDLQLAQHLGAMTQKGLKITLVLDCCRSGAVTRDTDCGVRGVEWNQSIDDEFPISKYETSNITISDDLVSDSRDTEWSYSWLKFSEKSKYSLITACAPHEKAHEHSLGGKKRGILSFYLRMALEHFQENNVHNYSTESLLSYVRSQIQKHEQDKPQNLMRGGDGELSLLIRLNTLSAGSVYVRNCVGAQVCLNVGGFHGVSKGDIYAAYPFDSMDHKLKNDKPPRIQLKVATLKGSICEALINTKKNNVSIGWKAILWKSNAQPIRVKFKDPCQGRTALVEAIQESRYPQLLESSGEQRLPQYYISHKKDRKYKIHNDNGKHINVPKVETVTLVVAIIEHIAKFELAKSLQNLCPANSFTMSYDVELKNPQGKPLDEDKWTDINHGDKVEVMFRNRGSKPLYFALYTLSSFWQINTDRFYVLDPYHTNIDTYKTTITETVPKHHTKCEDLVKVIVATSPVWIAQLRLPKVQELCKRLVHEESGRGSESHILTDDAGAQIPSGYLTMLDGERDSEFGSAASSSPNPRSRDDDWKVHTFNLRVTNHQEKALQESKKRKRE